MASASAESSAHSSVLMDVLTRAVTNLLPRQTAYGPFLADPRRSDPYPATPEDITLNRVIYVLARLPGIDDPRNAYFDDATLRDRAVRIGNYLHDVLGDAGGIPSAAAQVASYHSGRQSGLHALNLWTCPVTVRAWIQAFQELHPFLPDAQRERWRTGLTRCLELLAQRCPSLPETSNLTGRQVPRLGTAATTASALIIGGRVLQEEIFVREGERVWRQLGALILQAGEFSPAIDGMDLDILLGNLDCLHESRTDLRPDRRDWERRLAGWRASLTMPDGGVNELFDRHRHYSRFGMAAALPALERHGYRSAANLILEGSRQRNWREVQALPELSLLLASIEGIRGSGEQGAAELPGQTPDWFGGDGATRAQLYQGQGWTAGCRAPVATPIGFSCPWSARHTDWPCWIDGSSPDPRTRTALDYTLAPPSPQDALKHTIGIQAENFQGHFGSQVLDAQTLWLTARVHWALPSLSRELAGIQLLMRQKEGDHLIIREPSAKAVTQELTIQALELEFPSGSQVEIHSGAFCWYPAANCTGGAPVLKWQAQPRAGSFRLPLPNSRLEIFLPFAPGKETLCELVLSLAG